MDPICPVCNQMPLETPEDRATKLCLACRHITGLTHPPSLGMRPPHPCGRCAGTVFVRVKAREGAADGGEPARRRAQPLALTFHRAKQSAFFASEVVGDVVMPDLDAPAGFLEPWVCRSCGFVEWYCPDVGSLPIGVEYGTELVDVAQSTPYR